MKRVTVHVINAFVDEGRGGNPAGVVLETDSLTDEQKQFIAAEAGFSETAFVSQSNKADFKLDFFTPVCRIADCGHATVAVFCYLAEIGRIRGDRNSKEITDGVFDIFLKEDMAFMEQPIAEFNDLNADIIRNVLTALSLTSTDLLADYNPIIAVNSNAGIIVPLESRDSLKKIQPNMEAIEKISKDLNTVDIYPFTLETEIHDRDAGARMFAPILGIPEESATGMAAGRLACYIQKILKIQKDRLYIEQGHYMDQPSPSLLIADLDVKNSRLLGIKIGGSAKIKKTITVTVK